MTLFYHLYSIYFSMRKRRLYIFNKVNLDLFHVCKSVAAVALAGSCGTLLGLWVGIDLFDFPPTVRRQDGCGSLHRSPLYWLTWTHFKTGKSRSDEAFGVAYTLWLLGLCGVWSWVVGVLFSGLSALIPKVNLSLGSLHPFCMPWHDWVRDTVVTAEFKLGGWNPRL